MVANLQEFAHGAGARRRAHGEGRGRALYRLILSNNRRYGGYLSHIGLITLAVGVTASSAFRQETDATCCTLRPGEFAEMAGYTIRLDRVWAREEPHRAVVGVDLTAFRGDTELGRLDPRLNFFNGRDDPVTTPAVRSRLNEDLYVNLLAFDTNGDNATISIIIEPLVAWIWIGGLVIALGALVSVLPRRGARVAPPPARARVPAVEAS
jgi:cytochrome c-type biogenesis protein CcmF